MDHADQAWLAAVRAGRPPGRFGHREHLRLAWLALEDADSLATATRDVSASLRMLAAHHGAPQKYNETVSVAWVRIIHHVRSAHDVRSFDALLDVAPWLSDKRVLLRHYSSRTLAGKQARSSYVPPDLQPIPA